MPGDCWAWVRSTCTSASGRRCRSTTSATAKSSPATLKVRSATMWPSCCAALSRAEPWSLHRSSEADGLRQRGRRKGPILQLADVLVAEKDHERSLHAATRTLCIGEITILQSQVQNAVLR